jgi:hypothetical protein
MTDNAILCNAEVDSELTARRLSEAVGFTLADLCESYLHAPALQTRELILRTAIHTRADAVAVLTLLEVCPDDAIAAHLLRMVKLYLAAD